MVEFGELLALCNMPIHLAELYGTKIALSPWMPSDSIFYDSENDFATVGAWVWEYLRVSNERADLISEIGWSVFKANKMGKDAECVVSIDAKEFGTLDEYHLRDDSELIQKAVDAAKDYPKTKE